MKANGKAKVEIELTISLNESETRALYELSRYNMEDFLKVIYSQLGSHYVKPHEAGLRSFFEGIRNAGGAAISDVDVLRNAATKIKV